MDDAVDLPRLVVCASAMPTKAILRSAPALMSLICEGTNINDLYYFPIKLILKN